MIKNAYKCLYPASGHVEGLSSAVNYLINRLHRKIECHEFANGTQSGLKSVKKKLKFFTNKTQVRKWAILKSSSVLEVF